MKCPFNYPIDCDERCPLNMDGVCSFRRIARALMTLTEGTRWTE